MDKISIGKMALLNQVTEQTLRHYDRIGLLKPAYIDDQSRYRYYNIKQSAKLDMIQYMKALGMSLKQIKQQFETKDVTTVEQMLLEQKLQTEQRIEKLENMKNALDTCVINYNRYFKKPEYGQIKFENITKRKIFCYDIQKDVYECNLDDYEYMLRELKKQVTLQHLPMAYFCNVGSIIRKPALESNEFASSEIFLFVPENFNPPNGIEYIPESDFLCIYCDNFEEEKKYADKLLDFIKHNPYQIIGDYICEVVIELPIFYHNDRHLLIKIQIPVKKY